MRAKSYIADVSHSVASVLAGYSHTLPYCLSKPRSSLEAGKKQAKSSLEYGCTVEETQLYHSFCTPLVYLWTTFGDSEDARWCYGGQTLVTRRYNGEGSLMYAVGNAYSFYSKLQPYQVNT